MAQKLYLSRHGITLWNRLRINGKTNEIQDHGDPQLHILMEEGEEQAKRLGRFLKGKLRDPQKTYFVDTRATRTEATLRIATKEIPIELLVGQNYTQIREFKETTPLDLGIT